MAGRAERAGGPEGTAVLSLADHPRRAEYAALARPRDLNVNPALVTRRARRRRAAADAELAFAAVDGTVTLPWTMRCNQRCSYCAVRDGGPVPADPSESRLAELATAAVRAGFRKAFLVGGEPTVRAGLGAFVRGLRALGMAQVALGTNGLALAERGAVGALVDAGVGVFSVSLDSADPEVQASVTRNPANAARVARALEVIAGHDGVDLLVFALMCGPTLPGLERLVERVASLRAGARARVALCLTGLKPIGAAARHLELHVRYTEVRPYWEAALARARTLGLPLIDFNLPACVFPDNEDQRWELRVVEAIWNADLGILFRDPAYERNHVRLPACTGCAFPECPGVYRGYLERWGAAEFAARRRRDRR